MLQLAANRFHERFALRSCELFATTMKQPGKIQLTIYALGLAGAALFTGLLIRQGAASVGAAIATAGWGIAAVAAFHSVPLLLDTMAWSVLFPKKQRLRWQSLFWMRWIGESISNLVPSAAVGGDIVRARVAALKGVPLATAAASVIVDITLGVFNQAAFTVVGLVLLVQVSGRTNFIRPTLMGMLVGLVAIGAFYVAQRLGLFRFVGLIISRLANSRNWRSLVYTGETLDQAIAKLYARRKSLIACCALTIVSLAASSGEIWIALHAIGVHATFINALILQSAAFTIRSSFFLVPGALGVQESGYVLVGNLLGIPGEIAFAISLITRMRDLAVGIPALIAWQIIEGHRFLRARKGVAAR